MALSDDFAGPTELMAAFNTEDEFIGLLADSPEGLFVRADGYWGRITEGNRFFVGSTVVDVEEDFLEFFDKLDARNIEPTMKQTSSFAIKDEVETDD